MHTLLVVSALLGRATRGQVRSCLRSILTLHLMQPQHAMFCRRLPRQENTRTIQYAESDHLQVNLFRHRPSQTCSWYAGYENTPRNAFYLRILQPFRMRKAGSIRRSQHMCASGIQKATVDCYWQYPERWS